ncbi:MAG: staygreen family protein, partial [Anaerolineae bacterium]
MSRLRPEKLHVTLAPGTEPEALRTPRRYTLTHSDMTGDLYLTIDADYDRAKISGLLAHLMRDEVLAEWREGKDGHTLHVFCYVSGGLVLGTAGWRDGIFRHELPLVLEAFR